LFLTAFFVGFSNFDNQEADTFFCFSQVMSEVRDRFIKHLDNSEFGILSVVKALNGHQSSTSDLTSYLFSWI